MTGGISFDVEVVSRSASLAAAELASVRRAIQVIPEDDFRLVSRNDAVLS
jgi:hypothetical protein